jgi:hypothetical protein
MTSDVYYLQFAAAFVRGSLPDLPEDLALPALGDLEESQLEQIYAIGREAGLRLHRYKRSAQLPRVRKILGTLQGLCPAELLDLGTGRGVFLWPLLDEFPSIQVTCVDMLEHRIADLETVSRGGLTQVQPLLSELTQLPFEDKRFSCTTMLEVLEHTVDPQAALRESLPGHPAASVDQRAVQAGRQSRASPSLSTVPNRRLAVRAGSQTSESRRRPQSSGRHRILLVCLSTRCPNITNQPNQTHARGELRVFRCFSG